MEKYQVAVVVPAFNEEDTIANVVREVNKYGVVIVVNDASTDKTKINAENAGALVVCHDKNLGYDEALNSGFAKADELNCDAIISFDADGQHSPSALRPYISALKNGMDLVLGVRPKPARISERLFMYYTRHRFNWSDPLCGMKGYSMKLYRQRGYFDSKSSIGTELATYGLSLKVPYVQIIIPISDRQDQPRFSSLLKSNLKIIKALFNLMCD